ncbi:penicillin-binding protein 1C [Chitinivorax sp. PXF-14]|uniref:penicillin-binding protein 1C n=1 Tax=Chitinivorax sp. PXF-14 TaxID=3230488 RepID=UPI00346572FB
MLGALLPALSWAVPSFAEVKSAWQPSESWLLDRHGELLSVKRVDSRVRRLAWTPLAAVSPALQAAVLASEDRRFLEHAGIDWQALAGAALDRASGSPRGASTITMQLAGLLDDALKPGRDGRSVVQKLGQLAAAREIEAGWGKQEILEAYLNHAPFRGELVGVAAASARLFGKLPAGLNQGEGIVLAALLRGPNANADTLGRRACELAGVMQARVGCAYLQGLALQALSFGNRGALVVDDAPEAAARLLVKPGQSLRTTLDAGLQREARQILTRQLAALASRNVRDGTLLVLDNASGEVLAYVGHVGQSQVDGVQARRQAGSTLKPLLYGLAFEQRLLTPASLLDDSPVNLDTAAGMYVPQNYDKDFRGIVSVRSSLAGSLNVPAVRTLLLTGVEPFFERLQAAGFNLPERGDYYGYSLALGSPDITLWQLVNAYRSLANGGRISAPGWLPGQQARSAPLMQAEAAWLVADILSDRSARAITFGLENPLATRVWAAVKTGTSKDMRDNWCIGFTSRYTVGVWVGNFDGEPMWDVSGISGAAPVWREIVQRLHAARPSRQPAVPRGIVTTAVRFEPPIEPARREVFIAGTEQTVVRLAGQTARAIRYPGDGEIIALDPDIPPARQKIRFEADAGGRWWLDGKPLANGGDSAWWSPRPGRHVLAWAAGSRRDEVRFEVRGTLPARAR